MRRALPVVILLIVLSALVVVARGLLSDPIDELLEPTRGAPVTPGKEDDGGTPRPTDDLPSADRPGPTRRAWPFADWEREIVELRRADAPPGFVYSAELEVRVVEKLDAHRFDITMKDAEFQEVVDFLAAQMQPFDVRVYTREPAFNEDVTYNLDMRDVVVTDVVNELYLQSRKRLRWHLSELGYCVGSWAAIEHDKKERELSEARRRAKFDAQTPLLQVEYRPDFAGAHIGDIVRDIHEKTGVLVVVGREAWDNSTRVTWRTGDRPLSVVLHELAKMLGAFVRVKDGRAFLITP